MSHQPVPTSYDPESHSAQVLRSFGLEALVEIIETIGYGVCVTGDEHTWTYLNPAGARIIGGGDVGFAELRDTDYLLSFAEHERVALLALEHKQREGDRGFYTNTIVRPDGTEVSMTWSGTMVAIHGNEVAPAIFHEVTDARRTHRGAAELGAGAAQLARGGSTGDVLQALVEDAVAATRALAALVLLEGPDGLLRVGASVGFPDSMLDAVRRCPARLDELPAGDLVTRGRGGFLHDDRARLLASPVTRPWVEANAGMRWLGASKVPVRRDGRVAGVLVVVVPERITAPSESETQLWELLAEQAEVALDADRVRDEVSRASAHLERERIARDLHDSVNHSIFALQARAQAVERLLAKDRADLAREAAAGLAELAREATTEMRALLTELQEPEPDESPQLQTALRDLADSVSRRDGLLVALAVPDQDLVTLPPATVEHLVRIAGEALHNTVKHAGARRAMVSVATEGRDLVLRVEDDGRGFDTGVSRSVGHGQRTMRERADLIGASLSVVSRPGEGTNVVLRLPVPG